MASNSSLYEQILREIRTPLEKAVNDALSSLQAGAGTSRIRLEACLDHAHSGIPQSAQKETQRITLATIDLPCLSRGSDSGEAAANAGRQQLNCNEQNPQLPGGVSDDESLERSSRHLKRRRMVGGLRLAKSAPTTRDASPDKGSSRRLTSNARQFSKRNVQAITPQREQSPFERLVIGIWKQIHGSIHLNPPDHADLWHNLHESGSSTSVGVTFPLAIYGDVAFQTMNHCCRQITQVSRCCRSLEVIVQARWIQCYDEQVQKLMVENPNQSISKARMLALAAASKDFGWTQKELRNKIAIWRGYDIIREAGGWVSLIFAGMGLYRFCKYRLGFCPKNMIILKRLRLRFEVAADTIHPEWRRMLSVVGEQTTCTYFGHPCDWVVGRDDPPIPLADTYIQWTPDFNFEHLEDSIIDEQPFDRGTAIGEFVGVITKGLRDLDVVQMSGPAGVYQIWQGRQGNYTRFVNHSCQPNSQYERFVWLGVQRVVLVSKGISAGEEITVDYSDDYWSCLDKECLCGENCCRFKKKRGS